MTYRLPLPVVNEPCVHTAVSVGRSQGPKKLVPSGQMAAQPLFTQEPQGMARSQRSFNLDEMRISSRHTGAPLREDRPSALCTRQAGGSALAFLYFLAGGLGEVVCCAVERRLWGGHGGGDDGGGEEEEARAQERTA